MDWYMEVLRKYLEFSGRARRKEYWMFTLFNVLIAFILGLIDGVLGTTSAQYGGIGLLGGIYTLLVFLPSLAVSVRRLHDTNRSGWWLLISLIPIIGAVVLLIFMILDGTPGPNRFGPNPKTGDDELPAYR